MMLDEILLAIENAVATDDDTWPIFPCLMHSHLMLFPIRFRLEGLQRLQFGAIGAEHIRLSGLAMCATICEGARRGDAHTFVDWSVARLLFGLQGAAYIGCWSV